MLRKLFGSIFLGIGFSLLFSSCRTLDSQSASVQAAGAFSFCVHVDSGEMEYVHQYKLAMVPTDICIDEAAKKLTIASNHGNNSNSLAQLNFDITQAGTSPNFSRIYDVYGGGVQGQPLTLNKDRGDKVRYEISIAGNTDSGYLNIYETVVKGDLKEDFTTKLRVTKTGLLPTDSSSGHDAQDVACTDFSGVWSLDQCSSGGENMPSETTVKQTGCNKIRLFGTEFTIYDETPPGNSKTWATWDVSLFGGAKTNVRASNLIITPVLGRSDHAQYIMKKENGEMVMQVTQVTSGESVPSATLKCEYYK